MLFIYGTLREGGKNRSYLQGRIASSSPAHVLGRLYLSGTSPMLVLGGETQVQGELLEFEEEDAVFEKMDAFERAYGYSRKEISVDTSEGVRLAWAYIPDQLPADAVLIPGGDYITFSKK